MPKLNTPRKSKPYSATRRALALPLLLLLTACAAPPQPLPSAPVRSVQIPPLPAYARQPTPSVCLPSCLDALTIERLSWQKLLTPPESPGGLANGNMTPPAKP